MKDKALRFLEVMIEQRYGYLSNDQGCNVNGRWLSVKAISELIDSANEAVRKLPGANGEVVRCRECYFGKEDLICKNPLCTKSFYGTPVPPLHFCSYGRKESQ